MLHGVYSAGESGEATNVHGVVKFETPSPHVQAVMDQAATMAVPLPVLLRAVLLVLRTLACILEVDAFYRAEHDGVVSEEGDGDDGPLVHPKWLVTAMCVDQRFRDRVRRVIMYEVPRLMKHGTGWTAVLRVTGIKERVEHVISCRSCCTGQVLEWVGARCPSQFVAYGT